MAQHHATAGPRPGGGDSSWAGVKQKADGSAMMLYKGMGIRAGRKPMSTWPRHPGETAGHFWYIPSVSRTREHQHVLADVNYWKSFVHDRLLVAPGM